MFRNVSGITPPSVPFHYLNRQVPSLMATSGEADQNTASSRLVSKTPDQRDSRNQIQKRPGDGTWDPHSGLTELLPVQGALFSFKASFRQPGEKFSALHKACLVSGSEFRTAVHWRAIVRTFFLPPSPHWMLCMKSFMQSRGGTTSKQ